MRESVMGGAPPYVILGRGRWATRMRSILAAEGRSVSIIPVTRQASGEAEATYRSRLCEAMAASEAQIAWLCVLPGPHIPLKIEAALDAGLHVVVEKPWQGLQHVTSSLVARPNRSTVSSPSISSIAFSKKWSGGAEISTRVLDFASGAIFS